MVQYVVGYFQQKSRSKFDSHNLCQWEMVSQVDRFGSPSDDRFDHRPVLRDKPCWLMISSEGCQQELFGDYIIEEKKKGVDPDICICSFPNSNGR